MDSTKLAPQIKQKFSCRTFNSLVRRIMPLGLDVQIPKLTDLRCHTQPCRTNSTGKKAKEKTMFNYDPRMAHMYPTLGTTGTNTGIPSVSGTPNTYGPEWTFLFNRIEELRLQILATNELIRAEMLRRNHTVGHLHGHQTGYGNNMGSFAEWNSQYGQGPAAFGWNGPRPMTGFTNEIVRIRENDTHLFCDIFLPQLTVGDVDVEVSGNRIVCRTRIPVAPMGRWFQPMTQLPRGFEFFELPDGRVECSWLCPISFNPKEVEASFRDGFLSLIVIKAESANVVRHPIKVAREGGRRAANEMNS
jgi:HSP20 family molecular chaperone IbpA